MLANREWVNVIICRFWGRWKGVLGGQTSFYHWNVLDSEMKQRGPPVTLAVSVAGDTALLPRGEDDSITWGALRG